MNPEVWFSVTDGVQFVALLPVGVLLGYLILGDREDLERIAITLGEMVFVFWAFLLAVRAMRGVQWQASIGTALLSVLFVVAIYAGGKLQRVIR